MNRSDIIEKISELYPKLNNKDVVNLVKLLFETIAKNIAEGRRIEIRGFGCFSLKYRAAGKVRNPRYGVEMQSSERHVVYFRAGKELRERVDINRH